MPCIKSNRFSGIWLFSVQYFVLILFQVSLPLLLLLASNSKSYLNFMCFHDVRLINLHFFLLVLRSFLFYLSVFDSSRFAIIWDQTIFSLRLLLGNVYIFVLYCRYNTLVFLVIMFEQLISRFSTHVKAFCANAILLRISSISCFLFTMCPK